MEASEKPQLPIDGNPPCGTLGAIGDGLVSEPPTVNDERVTGFARLHLMVNTVLERLTRS